MSDRVSTMGQRAHRQGFAIATLGLGLSTTGLALYMSHKSPQMCRLFREMGQSVSGFEKVLICAPGSWWVALGVFTPVILFLVHRIHPRVASVLARGVFYFVVVALVVALPIALVSNLVGVIRSVRHEPPVSIVRSAISFRTTRPNLHPPVTVHQLPSGCRASHVSGPGSLP